MTNTDHVGYKYWAFISYSHRDEKWGQWLHRSIESYRVPKHLVGKQTRGYEVPKRILPIFRDREELPTSSDLGSNINEALRQSRYLIVICSPHSAKSTWVNEEIESFKAMGGENRILCLIVDGEPNATDKPDCVIPECFPSALRFCLDKRGALTDQKMEPLAADARKGKDGKANSRMKIIAGILGVGFDDLRDREAQRKRRRMIVALVIVSFLLFMVSMLAAISFSQWQIAEHQRRVAFTKTEEANRQLGNFCEEQGRQELLNGDTDKATAYLAEAYKRKKGDDEGLRFLLTQAAKSIGRYKIDGAVLCEDKWWSARIADGRRKVVGNTCLLTGFSKNTANVYNLKTGKVQRELKGHTDSLTSVFLHPKGDRVLTASLDGTAKVWDAKTGSVQVSFKGDEDFFREAVFNAAGDTIATVGSRYTVTLWSSTGKPLRSLEPECLVQQAIFSPNGKHIMGVCENRALVWDTQTGALISSLTDLENGFESAIFSHDGSRIATLSRPFQDEKDKKARLKIWEADTGKLAASIEEDGDIYGITAFSPDDKHIITAGKGFKAKIWDIKTGRLVKKLNGLKSLSASQDLALPPGCEDSFGEICTEGGLISLSKSGALVLRDEHVRPQGDGAFSSDGLRIVTIGDDGRVRTRDVTTGETLVELKQQGQKMRSAAFSPDGTKIVTTGHDGWTEVWNAKTGESNRVMEETGSEVKWAVFSPDGKRVCAGDAPVQVWDADTGKKVASLMGDLSGAASSFSNHECSSIVATSAFGNDAKLFDVELDVPECNLEEPNHRIMSARMSLRGALLTTGSNGTARVWPGCWDFAGSVQLKGHWGNVETGAFSPDGQKVATAGEDKTVKVWAADSGKLLLSLEGHKTAVDSVSFSPDGFLVLSVSRDHTARLWSAKTGKLLVSLGGDKAPVTSAAFSPDGSRLLTQDPNNVMLWDIHLETRTPEEIEQLVECYVPWKIEDGVLVPSLPDPSRCIQ